MAILISEAHAKCYFSFVELIETIKNPVRDFRDQLPSNQVQDEFDKYNLWAGNVGAAHSGKRYEISLDYRLREASFYRNQVLKLLETLDKTIKNALSLIRNERKPFEELPPSDEEFDKNRKTTLDNDSDMQEEMDDSPWEISSVSSDGNQSTLNSRIKTQTISEKETNMGIGTAGAPATNPVVLLGRIPALEMPRIFNSIKFTIICLYKIPIRRPAPLDRLKHKTSIEASFYQHFDVLYVMDKFRELDPDIATRLGKMVSRRRQILYYRESHDQSLDTVNVKPKIALPLPAAPKSLSPEINTSASQVGSCSEVARSQAASSQFTLRSKATTLRLEEAYDEDNLDVLYAPSTAESKSSLASSYAGKDLYVEVPPRPKGDDGKELDRFECPYCLRAMVITSSHKWKKHVFEDLQPYVCTYPDCELFDHFFESRDEWYKHEAQRHRVKWFCNTENHLEYETQVDFLTHMKHHHGTNFDLGQLSLLKDMFRQPSRAIEGQCNLCMRHSAKLRSHVSRHLQQIALFALPRFNETAGSEKAELNSLSSRRNKGDKKQPQDIEQASQTSQSTSVSGESQREEYIEHPNSQFDLQDLDNDVELIDVPDAVDPEWNKFINKFSKAREDNDPLLENFVKEAQLQLKLRQARICCDDVFTYFIPISDLNRLITTSVAEQEILKGDLITPATAKIYAHRIEKAAKKLFSILALQEKGAAICSLLDSNLSDQDLPFLPKMVDGQWSLWRREPEERIEAFDPWDNKEKEEFCRTQWWMIAPVFDKDSLECLELADKVILPFIHLNARDAKNERIPSMMIGGRSGVTAYRIHPAHHNFWNWDTSLPLESQPLIVVKTLYSTHKIEFLKEKTILDALGRQNHPNLIKMLASYQQHKKYHLLFPCADCNLRAFWTRNEIPNFDEETVLWSIRQMSGIASGLDRVHTFKVKINLNIQDEVRIQEDGVRLSVIAGEEKYGRHGNIKAETILYFKDERLLKITGFGFARFHGRDSRSDIDPRKICFTPTYEPPECTLARPISRKYDIWCLGCLFLEFITWLLEGSAKIDEFSDARGLDTGLFNDDNFFTVTDDDYEKVAEVREAVIQWVDQLHAHKNCSELIHDLLDLVMGAMLKIDPDERISAKELKEEMEKLVAKAESSQKYLLVPAPRPLHTHDPKGYEEYTVAVICAIDFEMSAVRYMLDREHPCLPTKQGDSNLYVLGELSGHNVVLACLPGNQGKGAAATVATNMARTFPSIRWRFSVGIGGGVPSDKHDIRLGDVVISMPDGQYGGVVQYDLGKDTENGFQLKGFLYSPPAILRNAVGIMKSDHLVNESRVSEFLSAMMQKGPRLSIYERPSDEPDILFEADYPHVPNNSTCKNCNRAKIVNRPSRKFEGPAIHYGLIASGDWVMKSATKRSKATHDLGDILCFEMEAAGIGTEFSCIVIRGISDYADSHKNDGWQRYAAATAAACAKEMLFYLDSEKLLADTASALPNSGSEPVARSDFRGVRVQHSGPGTFSVGGDLHVGGN